MAKRIPDPLATVEASLDYRFVQRALLEEALTHVSAGDGTRSYQRLEFLGDRVLGLVIAAMLFEAYPQASEGELSRKLANLVRKETCADIARALELAPVIRLGEGEKRSGARKRDALLGDVCEAVLGAVYCDGGVQAAQALIDRHWRPRLTHETLPVHDAKSRLQELVQGQGLGLPVYTEMGRAGPDHAPKFEIAVTVTGFVPAHGTGATKRHAQHAAASTWLERHATALTLSAQAQKDEP